MKKIIKKILKPFIPQMVLSLFRMRNQKKKIKQFHQKELEEWENNGFPVPPPHIVKQIIIKEYQSKYLYKTLVETGTYLGDMIQAQKSNFKKIYSIELGIDLFNNAKQRFKKDRNVIIIQGDSGKVLPDVLLKINEPAIFWLDGHYSAGITAKGDKDCPIFEELDAIFSYNNFKHILLIDDARMFVGEGDYPTIQELTNYIRSKNEKYRVYVEHDIIRCVI